MARNIFTYAAIAILLTLSTLPFLLDRTKATVKTVAFLTSTKDWSRQYIENDRYTPVVSATSAYPNSPIYFLKNSQDPEETSTSWQLIQTTYLLYPKAITQIELGLDDNLIENLQYTEAVVISPFKQKGKSFESAIEIHPHKEYYLYIFTQD